MSEPVREKTPPNTRARRALRGLSRASSSLADVRRVVSRKGRRIEPCTATYHRAVRCGGHEGKITRTRAAVGRSTPTTTARVAQKQASVLTTKPSST
jgi:hypothetical protein